MTNLSSRRGTAGSRIGTLAFAVLIAGGCGALTTPPGQAPIPSGSTVVHVVSGASGVRLEPATVPAGDVYLVLDDPDIASISFVQRQTNPNKAPGPLNNGDLARLGRGDLNHTAMTGLDAGGCDDDQNRQARGMVGPCGNALKMTLTPGKYAVLAGSPEEDPDASGPGPMAVLEVSG